MKNKTLTIDCAKWRCGHDSTNPLNKLGEGYTKMLNEEGFMCCLGQMACQLNKKVDLSSNNKMYPSQCKMQIKYLTTLTGDNSRLSNEAMGINDNRATTVKEKISLLRALFKKKSIALRFINQKVIK